MTDNEIIKALECAIEYGCGHYIEMDAPTIKKALDLINRQKAEIDSLNNRERILIYHIAVERERAIKDFAERLKELYTGEIITDDMHCSVAVIKANIDDIAKEMIGEQDESIQQEDC